MQPDPVLIIEAAYAARRSGDHDALRRLHHEDVVFTFNADPDKIGSGQRIVGLDQILAHIERVETHWDVLEYVAEPILGSGMVYSRFIRVKMYHPETRRVLEGNKRHVITVIDGRIAAFEETLDRNLVQALQRFQRPDESSAA